MIEIPVDMMRATIGDRRRVMVFAALFAAVSAQNASSGSSQTCEALSVDNISPLVVKAEYAVRGRLLARAMELEAVLKAGGDGAAALPFKRIVRCNIGNPQAVGQKPTTFVRQVLSLVMNPAQLSGLSKWAYPKDAIARAKHYLAGIPSLGAYSDSQGIMSVRKEVADFIAARDGHPASPSDIFLTDGASAGVKALMQLLVRGPHDAVLVPVPQYPLYSAVTTLLNGTLAPYYLDEDAAWGVQEAELRRALTAAKAGGADDARAVRDQPGQPDGAVAAARRRRVDPPLRREGEARADGRRGANTPPPRNSARNSARNSSARNSSARNLRRAIISRPPLCSAQVYQENVYGDAPPFVSFKKVLSEMAAAGDAAAGGVQLVSFHSTSKGFFGECGLRGGYFEMVNVDAEVRAQLLKLASISLCSNTVGQLATGLMVRPPAKGEPSHRPTPRSAALAGLAARAQRIAAALNALPGGVRGGGRDVPLPRVRPQAAVAAAAKQGMAADEYYSIKLLEATGLVVVPGSGFKQVEGTHHFRTTFLPPADMLDEVLPKLATFHTDFIAQHGGAK